MGGGPWKKGEVRLVQANEPCTEGLGWQGVVEGFEGLWRAARAREL